MGRPRKEKLDYFQLDTDMFEDLTIRKLIRRCGGEAVLVYIAFLQQIYKSKNGYYFEVDEDTAFIIAEQICFEEEYIKKALDGCIALGLFDAELYRENNILTSASIQERYCFIRKRKVSDLQNYCIISDSCFEEKTGGFEEKTEVSEKKHNENQSLLSENAGFTRKNEHNNNIYNNSNNNRNKNKKEINKEKALPVADAPVEREPEKIVNSLSWENGGNPIVATLGKNERDGSVAPATGRVDYGKVVELYHTTCKSFPRIRGLTEQRKAKIKQRLAEMGGNYDTLAEVFRKMETSEFMRSGGWASFDWVFANSQNWMKILEGNYDNDRRNNQNGKSNAGLDPRFNFSAGNHGVDAEQYPDVL